MCFKLTVAVELESPPPNARRARVYLLGRPSGAQSVPTPSIRPVPAANTQPRSSHGCKAQTKPSISAEKLTRETTKSKLEALAARTLQCKAEAEKLRQELTSVKEQGEFLNQTYFEQKAEKELKALRAIQTESEVLKLAAMKWFRAQFKKNSRLWDETVKVFQEVLNEMKGRKKAVKRKTSLPQSRPISWN